MALLNIYESEINVVDKDNGHTAVANERCKLSAILIIDRKPFSVLINSQGNNLHVPYDIFKDFFSLSRNQISPL